ncbi:MAG TPA: hypothetical protein VHX42_05405 [Candidatus Babeliales bacterium]|jgi:ankyrin repeat protein|nr:hypothetical protein [Candidatus Babeliales bacterium]
MQKLCMMIMVSMLCVSNTFGMEQLSQDVSQSYGIDKKMMFGFMNAHDHTEFIKENPHIINAWVQPVGSSHDSYTLLHCMVEKDKVVAVRTLLEAGAQSNIATQGCKHTSLHMVRSKEMAELLLEYKEDLENKDKNGKTPLYHVLFNRDINTNYSGYFDIRSHEHQEMIKKRNELAYYLLEQGANSNAVDNDERSLLHRSIGGQCSWDWSYPQYLTWLMRFSADIEIKDSNGKTPYDLAIDRIGKCKEILEVLRAYNIADSTSKCISNIDAS